MNSRIVDLSRICAARAKTLTFLVVAIAMLLLGVVGVECWPFAVPELHTGHHHLRRTAQSFQADKDRPLAIPPRTRREMIMEVLAVRQARLIAFLRAEELNPEGRPIAHDFMKSFVERYGFLKFPQKADDLLDPENKGVTFELGKLKTFGMIACLGEQFFALCHT